MDFVGYAALGGLERVTIVAGAIIIGYWGYRLYADEKTAGVVFMGLAVLVLVGALATGTRHLQSVGEGLQLASVPAAPEAASAPSAPEPAAAEPLAGSESPPPVSAPAPAPASPVDTTDAPAADAGGAADAESAVAEVAETAAGTAPSPVRLATGQELGGRIMSVKSENVSLEWSTDSD